MVAQSRGVADVKLHGCHICHSARLCVVKCVHVYGAEDWLSCCCAMPPSFLSNLLSMNLIRNMWLLSRHWAA